MYSVIYTHYHNSNLIWRTRSVEGNPMVWPHPRDVIQYARSSYYYDNMFIICLFSDIPPDLNPVLVFNPKKLRERLP